MPKPCTVQEPAELLAFLFATWPEVKRKQVRLWLKHRAVRVNGRPVTQFDHPLRPGDVVGIGADGHAQPRAVLSRGMRVHREDAALVVIEKPANLLSMASAGERERTAYFQLTDYVRQSGGGAGARVWIVHRLDRETSGLMVFAKTERAKVVLQANWTQVEKRYQAVVEGCLPAEMGVFESELDESQPARVRSGPRTDRTRHAVTRYRVVGRGQGRTLVELTLETGRRHQIRVQLADAGCPIVGDEKYGARTDPAGRLGLHACLLRFPHPLTREEWVVQSPLPEELRRLV